ncbi:unnamed protein product [Ranitomeya imitator]|uniref:Uncharacterized protein n=1 Tax=Ranitomeya imitator TaxID=111125 RepID=A0ABN9LEC2_9NEOB|nr:unnamed protein product [Ranitomeya imitator]
MSTSTSSQELLGLNPSNLQDSEGNAVRPEPALLKLLHTAGAKGDTFTLKQESAGEIRTKNTGNPQKIRRAKASEFFQAISSLKEDWVIIPVPQSERFQGFYSNLFIVPKKDGTVRPILDLKLLNKFVRVRRFRMESLRSVIASMEKGEFWRL